MTSIPANINSPQSRRDGPSPWFVRLPILFLSGVILLVLVLTIAVGLFEIAYHGKIIPGVSAYGVNLTGMTAEQAQKALDSHFTYDRDAVFTFRDGDKFWQLTAGDLGVTFDAQKTAVEAVSAGHSGNLVFDIVDQMLMWLNGHDIVPTIHYDQNIAVSKLEAIAKDINRQAQNAVLILNGTDALATPSQVGRTVNILATLERLNDTIAQLNSGEEVPLVIDETRPQIWDAQAAANKAKIALSAPLQLVADNPNGEALGPWTASIDQIARLLKPSLIDNGDGTQSYDIDIDMAAFSAYLNQLAPGLLTTPKDARFSFDEKTNQLQVIQPSVQGRQLNVPQTLARMQQAAFDLSARTVNMAFDYTLATYHEGITGAEVGITAMVSQATTYFTGSTQPRRDNIAQAASRFNGIIVGPHEEFSFNEWVGDISPEAGFVSGKVIVGGRTIDGVGGGVCQVSTTAFQAAFYAGYPILERYAHGYDVGYYRAGEGIGMDAAIYTPDLDMRFLNDTDYALLIETSVFPSSNAVQFRFYSTNPGRQVVKEGPVVSNVRPPAPTQYEVNPNFKPGQSLQVDWAAEGKDVTVTRKVLDRDGNLLHADVFTSHYLPWGAVIQVAPGQAPST